MTDAYYRDDRVTLYQGDALAVHALGAARHVQAAPGVPIPDRMRP